MNGGVPLIGAVDQRGYGISHRAQEEHDGARVIGSSLGGLSDFDDIDVFVFVPQHIGLRAGDKNKRPIAASCPSRSRLAPVTARWKTSIRSFELARLGQPELAQGECSVGDGSDSCCLALHSKRYSA